MKKVNILIFAGFMSLSMIMTSCDEKGNKTPEKELAEYTIKFVDYDKELLSEVKVKEGTLPVYDKEEPFRDPTRQTSYTFSGWTPTIVAATADATYTATYTEEVRKYTIKFVDDDDRELQKEALPYGEMPEFKAASPSKAATAQYTYSFAGWDKPIVTVTGNATYKATYNSVVNQYQVIFDTKGGSNIDSQSVPYGGHVSKPDDPTKEATGDTYYVFEGWDFDFDNTVITGPTTIEAIWYEVDSSMPHGNNCVYIHYPQYLPRTGEYGYKEFWYCPVHHQYVMAEPASTHIVEATSSFSGEILSSDERFISLIYDENHLPLNEYSYGADQYLVEADEYETWKVTYDENSFDCLLYSDSARKLLWRIELPRIDYTRYPTVTMKVDAPNWYEGNMMGPEEDQLTYHTTYGGNKDKGKINLTLKSTGLYMEFVEMEHANYVAFTNTFTDANIINGLAPAYFYIQDLYDRHLIISNINISTARTPEDIYSYGADTSKLSVVNGDVKTTQSTDYSVIGNGYATNETSLIVDGNANPGAAVITLPAINFNQYTTLGTVSFKFGVRNNNEHMYFGSGDSKVDLGTNASNSESNNNNGFVNWEMFITASEAHIHNTYENHDYTISLTTGMRNGTESIVISGGNTSMYRRYLVCDFYLVS